MSKVDQKLEKIERQLESISNTKVLSQFSIAGHDPRGENDDLNLIELWRTIWIKKWIILLITAVFAIAAVIYALSLTNRYRSSTLLVPSEDVQGRGMSRVAGQLGGLASLAGFNVGGSMGEDKVAIAIAVLESRAFITKFIETHNILPELMAIDKWNRASHEIRYDPNIYNVETKKWTRSVEPPKTPEPSLSEAFREFKRLLEVVKDPETGFVRISVTHKSPYIAKEWVELLVDEVNNVVKENDVDEARRSIRFLESRLSGVAIADMRAIFYQLVEEQTKTIMLAEVRDEYIFRTIDPPVVADLPYSPNRSLICILITFFGGAFAIFGVLVWSYLFEKNESLGRGDDA